MVVPDRLRGRVLSLYGYVFCGTAPLGGLFTGWICGRFGTWLYLLIAGGVSVVAAVVGVIAVQMRRAQLARAPATGGHRWRRREYGHRPRVVSVRQTANVFKPNLWRKQRMWSGRNPARLSSGHRSRGS
jgi:hypothetical protein